MSAITWTTETRRLGDLVDWPKNPATISDHDAEHLRRSIEKFGLALPFIAQPNGDLIDGHQRRIVMALTEEYSPDSEVDVRVPSRQLSEEERAELAVRLRRNAGEWNWDILTGEFEADDLKDWGFEGWQLVTGDEQDVDYDEMWKGMPEFVQDDITGVGRVIVHFATEDDIKEFSELVEQNVTKETKFIWFPRATRANLKELTYRDES